MGKCRNATKLHLVDGRKGERGKVEGKVETNAEMLLDLSLCHVVIMDRKETNGETQ